MNEEWCRVLVSVAVCLGFFGLQLGVMALGSLLCREEGERSEEEILG